MKRVELGTVYTGGVCWSAESGRKAKKPQALSKGTLVGFSGEGEMRGRAQALRCAEKR
jgi:hypothetical protein